MGVFDHSTFNKLIIRMRIYTYGIEVVCTFSPVILPKAYWSVPPLIIPVCTLWNMLVFLSFTIYYCNLPYEMNHPYTVYNKCIHIGKIYHFHASYRNHMIAKITSASGGVYISSIGFVYDICLTTFTIEINQMYGKYTSPM